MSIYKERTHHTIYRKIYEEHFGPIPKEENGRTYDIHHIDGDHTNNTPSNLRAVTLQEHYDIHYSQGDWYACWKLSGKLQKSPMEISHLARLEANRRVANGTHHFSDGNWQRENQKKIMANGDHHFIGATNPVYDLIESGLHPWVGERGSKLSSIMNKERVKNGTHNFLGTESNKKRIENGISSKIIFRLSQIQWR
jgi:hypothetical protein